jgi:hypothetical protein
LLEIGFLSSDNLHGTVYSVPIAIWLHYLSH